MKKILLTAALAFASILSASAANPLVSASGATNGSLVLGFEDPTDSVAFDYEVALTNSTITTAAGLGTTPLGAGVVDTFGAPALAADLSTTFGTGWATNSNVTWSVFGVHSSAGGTDTNFYDTSSDLQQSQATTSNVWGSIRPVANTLVQTSYLTYPKGAQVSASLGTSYTTEISGGTGQDWNTFNDPTQSTGVGALNDIELYYYTGQDTNPIDIGTVNLSSTGTLTISGPAASPEPSTYALMLTGLTVLAVFSYRKSVRA